MTLGFVSPAVDHQNLKAGFEPGQIEAVKTIKRKPLEVWVIKCAIFLSLVGKDSNRSMHRRSVGWRPIVTVWQMIYRRGLKRPEVKRLSSMPFPIDNKMLSIPGFERTASR